MTDGQRIAEDDTPEKWELEDGDVIEVFNEQIGGGGSEMGEVVDNLEMAAKRVVERTTQYIGELRAKNAELLARNAELEEKVAELENPGNKSLNDSVCDLTSSDPLNNILFTVKTFNPPHVNKDVIFKMKRTSDLAKMMEAYATETKTALGDFLFLPGDKYPEPMLEPGETCESVCVYTLPSH